MAAERRWAHDRPLPLPLPAVDAASGRPRPASLLDELEPFLIELPTAPTIPAAELDEFVNGQRSRAPLQDARRRRAPE
jgi:hypothetical protein